MEMDWWQSVQHPGSSVRVVMTPAQVATGWACCALSDYDVVTRHYEQHTYLQPPHYTGQTRWCCVFDIAALEPAVGVGPDGNAVGRLRGAGREAALLVCRGHGPLQRVPGDWQEARPL